MGMLDLVFLLAASAFSQLARVVRYGYGVLHGVFLLLHFLGAFFEGYIVQRIGTSVVLLDMCTGAGAAVAARERRGFANGPLSRHG